MISSPSRPAVALGTVAGLASGVHYFSWLLQPERVGVVALFALLVCADLFNGFHAVSFWLTCLRRRRRRSLGTLDVASVDVLVPTLNEPVELVEATVRAAGRMRSARVRVILLDDGARPEMRRMAEAAGAAYIARAEHTGAKAGNLNHALTATAEGGAPLVCVLDCDQRPLPELLERTLGFFTDPNVALVQTPQVYRNREAGPLTRGAAEQQALFFGPICSGRESWGATFCCGTNFVVRRDALQRVGGFPEDSITEDIVLSARLAGLGYEQHYVAVPLAEGVGPEDARSYMTQQLRWATGCVQLLLRRRSLWRPLSWTQRWQYFVATSYWLTGWTIAIYLSLPVMQLLLGWRPVTASGLEFVEHFLPYFVLSIVNLSRFTGGGYGLAGLAMHWGSFAIHIRATLRVLCGRPGGFVVTPKHAVPGLPWAALGPNLLVTTVVLAAVTYGLVGGVTPTTVNAAAFAALTTTFVTAFVVLAVRQAHMVSRRDQANVPAVPAQPAQALRSHAR